MKSPNRAVALWLPVILTGLLGGCSTGGHVSTVRALAPRSVTEPNLRPATDPNPPTAVAQAAGSCWNSMSCCIQNHPLTPVQSCGADPIESAQILKTLQELDKAAQSTLKGVDVPEREEGGEGEGEGEGTPEWKKKCMALYEECQEKKWRGNCGDCFRYCEGQRGTWPFKKCRER